MSFSQLLELIESLIAIARTEVADHFAEHTLNLEDLAVSHPQGTAVINAYLASQG